MMSSTSAGTGSPDKPNQNHLHHPSDGNQFRQGPFDDGGRRRDNNETTHHRGYPHTHHRNVNSTYSTNEKRLRRGQMLLSDYII